MDIVTEKEVNGRLIDGIKTILTLNDEDFEQLVTSLKPQKGKILEGIFFYYTTDSSECPDNPIQLGIEKSYDGNKFIGRSYFGVRKTSIHDIFYQLSGILSKFDENSNSYKRIVELLKTRDSQSLINSELDESLEQSNLSKKVLQILSDEDTFNRFMDFENNREHFTVNGNDIGIGEYLKYLGNIFGSKNQKGQLKNITEIYNNYYIPELPIFQERYSQIIDQYNMDRFVNPMYEFRNFNSLEHIGDCIIRKGEEPEWEINPELREAIYKDFPEDGTLEEKAMHIYCKLCKELQYDEGYFYREQLPEGKYEYDFSKEKLESITPNSRITCWDFSRIFAKMVNELEGDIEAVIISKGINQGHFLAGFYTDKVSATVEAINARSRGTNDLMKAKNGISFEGIEIISDRDELIKKALDKVYPKVMGKNQVSIDEYLEQLKSLPTEEVPNDTEKKLQAFIDVMKENDINGNEAMQTLNLYYNAGFFGEKLKKAFVGRKEEHESREEFKRSVLITTKAETMQMDTPVYSIDTERLKLSKHTAQEIIEQLNSGELIYEDSIHTLPDIDEEGR